MALSHPLFDKQMTNTNRYTHLADDEHCDDFSDEDDADDRPCFPTNSVLLARQQREVEDVQRRYGPASNAPSLQQSGLISNFLKPSAK